MSCILLLLNEAGGKARSNFLTQVGSIFVSRVGSESGFGKFPQKIPNFSIFGIKKFWVKKYQGQRQVSLLFTVGQKYARVDLGQGPSLTKAHFPGDLLGLFFCGLP